MVKTNDCMRSICADWKTDHQILVGRVGYFIRLHIGSAVCRIRQTPHQDAEPVTIRT